MRNTYFLLLVLALSLGVLKAQENPALDGVISDFENLGLPPGTYWDGSDLSGSFNSGLASFPNDYNPDWFAWNQWAYSSMADDTTTGFMNQFSAITAAGYDPGGSNGSTYAVSYIQSDFLTTELIPVPLYFSDSNSHIVEGFYVTNATYPYLSMLNGDDYSKKFGGETGDDPDYFKLFIWGVMDGNVTVAVEFYLADYRFLNNDEDYIIDEWTWVDLESLGEVDSLMFSMASTDVGMFGINTPTFFCMDNLSILPASNPHQNYISQVHEYMPAPGQHINALPWGMPSAANSIIGGMEGALSLGAFGGYVVFSFEEAVENDPDNPFGVDFTIFGNPMTDASEPGVVFVMTDSNQNALPDDTWYLLAGSDYWFSNSSQDYRVTYTNPGGHADVPWSDNLGSSGFIFANSIHEQAYYPATDSFPAINPDHYMLSGPMIRGAIDTSSPAFVRSPQRAFGYADNRLRGSQVHTFPDNPYTDEVEGSGGDAFDISWAIDSLGNYVELDRIHFVKVQTGMMGDLGWLGEISTEVTGAVDVTPEPGTNYALDMVVIKDLPLVIDTSAYRLEGFAFHAGRIQPDAELIWETSVLWAEVDEGMLIAEQSGELEITAKLLSDPEISTTVTARVELPSAIPLIPHSRILITPNPSRNYFKVSGVDDVLLQVYDLSGQLLIELNNYSDGEAINSTSLTPGLYIVKITADDFSTTIKLIQQ